jgi:hypothetical protein
MIWWCDMIIYDMIYLTAIGLSPGGSTHLHTNNTQNDTNNNRTTQITTNVEECGPCPVFASFTLTFALQLRIKHGKPSVTLRKTSVTVQYTYYQNTHILQNPHKHTHYKTHIHTHSHISKQNKTTTVQIMIMIMPYFRLSPLYKLQLHSLECHEA